jgi:hypothetical protein
VIETFCAAFIPSGIAFTSISDQAVTSDIDNRREEPGMWGSRRAGKARIFKEPIRTPHEEGGGLSR